MYDDSVNRIEIKVTMDGETISMTMERAILLEDVLDFLKRMLMAKGHVIASDEELSLIGPNKEGVNER